MRYYSEEDVSEMLAKEFDEACSYSKPYSGVKMSDYPSIEIPQTNWHTGTPTEEGFWLVKYECVVDGKYKGRLTYRAVKIEKDKIDGFAYESGGIGAEEYWKPIEYQKIDELWKGEE